MTPDLIDTLGRCEGCGRYVPEVELIELDGNLLVCVPTCEFATLVEENENE